MLEIKLLKDCWGSYSFFGYKDGRQYTEAYDTIEELIEDNNEFKGILVTIKNNYDWKLTLIGNLNLLDSETIDELKKYNDTIFWNDADCYYWMMDFKINDTWFSANQLIDTAKKTMTLEVFQ